MVKESGADFFLVSIPMSTEKIELLRTISSEYKFHFLDLSPSFKEERDYIIPDDGHWNVNGHRIAAQAIEPVLERIINEK